MSQFCFNRLNYVLIFVSLLSSRENETKMCGDSTPFNFLVLKASASTSDLRIVIISEPEIETMCERDPGLRREGDDHAGIPFTGSLSPIKPKVQPAHFSELENHVRNNIDEKLYSLKIQEKVREPGPLAQTDVNSSRLCWVIRTVSAEVTQPEHAFMG